MRHVSGRRYPLLPQSFEKRRLVYRYCRHICKGKCLQLPTAAARAGGMSTRCIYWIGGAMKSFLVRYESPSTGRLACRNPALSHAKLPTEAPVCLARNNNTAETGHYGRHLEYQSSEHLEFKIYDDKIHSPELLSLPCYWEFLVPAWRPTLSENPSVIVLVSSLAAHSILPGLQTCQNCLSLKQSLRWLSNSLETSFVALQSTNCSLDPARTISNPIQQQVSCLIRLLSTQHQLPEIWDGIEYLAWRDGRTKPEWWALPNCGSHWWIEGGGAALLFEYCSNTQD